ncbi:hypothetical protein DQX05_29805 [Paenibacillus thiaminolyticus]|uniref:Uncharacterized protein n=1 Tax=Paenibacillus thiaminolyticus TaxID=49283 RepID=A0A3A3GUP2_PANTH|nr:hypothetical protein DQX05_29805 [Paenibacillus thiaminolyticus]
MPWDAIGIHGMPSDSMGFQGMLWGSTRYHGVPWDLCDSVGWDDGMPACTCLLAWRWRFLAGRFKAWCKANPANLPYFIAWEGVFTIIPAKIQEFACFSGSGAGTG